MLTEYHIPNMKKVLYLALLIAFSYSITAQTTSKVDNAVMNSFTKQQELNNALSGTQARNVTSFDNRYEGVKGSPFLYEEWLDGKLILADSAIVSNQMLYKFDAFKNEVWIKMTNGQERILNNNELLALEFYKPDGKKIKFKKVKLPESENRHHFAVSIFEGQNTAFFKDVKKVFRKANLEDKGIVTIGNAYDWFEENITFYIKKGNTPPVKVSIKSGSIIEALKLSKPATESVEKFCKTNNIKGKMTEDEAVKMMEYVDSLLEK